MCPLLLSGVVRYTRVPPHPQYAIQNCCQLRTWSLMPTLQLCLTYTCYNPSTCSAAPLSNSRFPAGNGKRLKGHRGRAPLSAQRQHPRALRAGGRSQQAHAAAARVNAKHGRLGQPRAQVPTARVWCLALLLLLPHSKRHLRPQTMQHHHRHPTQLHPPHLKRSPQLQLPGTPSRPQSRPTVRRQGPLTHALPAPPPQLLPRQLPPTKPHGRACSPATPCPFTSSSAPPGHLPSLLAPPLRLHLLPPPPHPPPPIRHPPLIAPCPTRTLCCWRATGRRSWWTTS